MIPHNTKGQFIVVEGLDGSGKTTQAHLISEELQKQGTAVVLTKEPTATSSVAQKIADALAKKIKKEPKELQQLFTQDRKEHVEKTILPNLREGKTVISDRYAFSTFAYGGLSTDIEWLKEINNDFPLPDLTLFIDVEPKECLQRIGGRGKDIELFEEEKKLEQIRTNYLEVLKSSAIRQPAEATNFKLIDGSGTIEETHKQVMQHLSGM